MDLVAGRLEPRLAGRSCGKSGKHSLWLHAVFTEGGDFALPFGERDTESDALKEVLLRLASEPARFPLLLLRSVEHLEVRLDGFVAQFLADCRRSRETRRAALNLNRPRPSSSWNQPVIAPPDGWVTVAFVNVQ